MYRGDRLLHSLIEELSESMKRRLTCAFKAIAVGDHHYSGLVPEVAVRLRRWRIGAEPHDGKRLCNQIRHLEFGIDQFQVASDTLRQYCLLHRLLLWRAILFHIRLDGFENLVLQCWVSAVHSV